MKRASKCLSFRQVVRFLLLCALGIGAAAAQQYPARSVRVITAFPAGSGPDTALRSAGEKLSRAWGQQVVVENRPGGNGFIAAGAGMKATPDGYTLVQMDSSHLAVQPHLYKNMPYDVARDFEPVATFLRTYFFVVVPFGSSWKNVPDLIAAAKAQGGKLAYGSWFVGSPGHLGTAMLEAATGTRMTHILFKDFNQLYTAVGNNDVAWAFGSAGSAGPAYQAKRVRFLAAAAPRRITGYADVPTVVESGGPPGFELKAWVALMAPRGTPGAIITRVNDQMAKALAEPDVIERYAVQGYEPLVLAPAEVKRLIETESRRFGEVIKPLNIALD